MNPAEFFSRLDARGKEYGLGFGPQTRMSNSRKAMEAGEFAKEQGRYERYHEAVFKAFFTDLKDIGDREVIRAIARAIGLDVQALDSALDAGTYLPRLEESSKSAREKGISVAPTFLIQGAGRIAGAQPERVFRAALAEIMKTRPQGKMK